MDVPRPMGATAMPTPEQVSYTLWQLVRCFMKLGTLGFGGQVVITSGFIGYLVAGFAGAYVAALGTFLPCYAFVVIAALAFRKYGKRSAIAAFVKGATVAAVGAISGAVIILGWRTITDIPTLVLALVTLPLLWRWKEIPEPFIMLGAAVIVSTRLSRSVCILVRASRGIIAKSGGTELAICSVTSKRYSWPVK